MTASATLKVSRLLGGCVEMVRKIRDEHANALEGKSSDEVLAFYREAGDAAVEDAARRSADGKKRRPSRPAPGRS